MDAILHEVRLLRQAIDTVARAHVVAQVSVGRLHIKEQRMAVASQRLSSITAQLSSATENAARGAATIARLEDERPVDVTQHAERQQTLEFLKSDQARYEAMRARLAAEQQDAAHALAIEQAQWAMINQRLDDVERTLAPKRN
jgi:hypothetical protein